MSSKKRSFNEWFEELKELANHLPFDVIIEIMVARDYFYEGLSPDEALSDYLS